MATLANHRGGYGLVARLLHWSMALAIFAMFGVGVWMRQLGYYDPWYKMAPDLHKSVGIVLLALLSIRFCWRLVNREPENGHLGTAERVLSQLVHWGFYALLLALMIAGYLISTADGRPIVVFGTVSIPSVYQSAGMESVAGRIHEYLAYAVIGLAGLHLMAALKHQFIDQDDTLARMWRGHSRSTPSF